MNPECVCDSTSEEASDEKREEEIREEEDICCNRIFLNFTRECSHPVKDRFTMVKVKELFKYLSERPDLQEMKVSGWRDEGKEEEEDELEQEEEVEEEEKDGFESYYDDDGCPKGGGQRFAMSRDFWYRKLNTLKAQKLDEVALETMDLPPDGAPKDPKCIKWIRNQKKYASDVEEKAENVRREICLFNESVAKPVEKELKKRFVNVYDNRRHFTGGCS